jgi:hypothetical protein
MFHAPRLPALAIAFVLAAYATVCCADDVARRPRVLVLRNGQVLTGQITHAGDRYIVAADRSSELRVPTGDVEMCCLDLEEAYARKRHRLPAYRAQSHLDLAEWCLRHGLFASAADELLEAISIEPNHPRIRPLESRLQMAVAQPPSTRQDNRQSSAAVDLNELERTMQSLPEQTVKQFTEHIQPLLLNRCGATACHGAATRTDFRVVRPSWGKTVPRRFTQRNLHAALRWVDLESAPDSQLIVAPSKAHGGVPTGVFGQQDDGQYELLVEWVKQVAHREHAMAPSTIEMRTSNLLQASFEQPVLLPPTGEARQPATSETGSPTATPKAPPAGEYQPRDAFDPGAFNRRHFPSRRTDAAASSEVTEQGSYGAR